MCLDDICSAPPGSRFKRLCPDCADAEIFNMRYGEGDEYYEEYGEVDDC
jgi:hypothetical protein